MKVTIAFLFISFIGSTLSFFTLAQGAGTQSKGIEVTGKSTVLVKPDQFSLSLTVSHRGKSASKIKALVDHKSTLVVNAAKNLLIKAEDIQSARVNLYPIYQKPSNSSRIKSIEIEQALVNGQQARVSPRNISTSNKSLASEYNNNYVFDVSRQIHIKLKNIEDYDRLLDQVVKIGVTHISALQMSVSKADYYYQQALLQAIADAKQKALIIAKQAGVSINKVLYLKESGYNAPSLMSNARTRMVSAPLLEHTSQVGTQNISAQVQMIFSIK